MPGPISHLTALPQINSAGTNPKMPESQDHGELEKACRDFESLFVNYMMKQMRETIPKDGLFGNSQAEQIYNSMLDQEVAKTISKQRGMGLAALMYNQMSGLNEKEITKK